MPSPKFSKRFKDNFSQLAIVTMIHQEKLHLHNHDFSELVIITGGTGTHYTEDYEYEISAGDVFVIQSPQTHGYKDTVNLSLINVIYRLPGLNLPMADITCLAGYRAIFEIEPRYRSHHRFRSRLQLGKANLKKAVRLSEKINEEMKNLEAGSSFMAKAAFMELICFLSRLYPEMEDEHPKDLLQLG
ncbi:MAG: AraC family ligand binding domain-containing protein, partial [Planctomycetota bacterium]